MQKREQLRRLLSERALTAGSTRKLSSGGSSTVYFDCKRVTLAAEGMPLVGDVFLDALAALPEDVKAVGGLSVGADPITAAVVLRAPATRRWDGFYVRPERKAHGTQQQVENKPPPGTQVAIVDDVVTSGGSVLKAVQAVIAEGLEVKAVVVLVDREEGAEAAIRARVPEYQALFRRSDFPRIAKEAGR